MNLTQISAEIKSQDTIEGIINLTTKYWDVLKGHDRYTVKDGLNIAFYSGTLNESPTIGGMYITPQDRTLMEMVMSDVQLVLGYLPFQVLNIQSFSPTTFFVQFSLNAGDFPNLTERKLNPSTNVPALM